jgi:arylsulfatase A-like enzyme
MPVILVTIDSASAADLDLYGAPRKTMPALARWAGSAVVFDRAFSVGPSTRLSLPSLVTGRYLSSLRQLPNPRAHGAWAKGNVTLADVLDRAGYRTIAVAPDPYFARTLAWVYQGFSEVIRTPASGPAGLTAPLVTDAALTALRTGAGGSRVLLWAHYSDAHVAKKTYTMPSGMEPFPGGTTKDAHDTKLLYVDREIDRLLAGIAEIFGDAPRLSIVTADHGESFDPSHMRKAKARHAWDLSTSVTRIPLVVSSPYGAPHRTERVASTIDVMPTILNAVGLAAKGVEGDSLVPTLLGGADGGRPILQQMFLPEFVGREGKDPLFREAVRRRELVLYRVGAVYSLFDWVRDPGEDRDLVDARPDAADDLAEIMSDMSEAGRRVDNAAR